MHFTTEALIRAVAVLAIEGTVCAVAARRGLFQYFPVFTIYLYMVVVSDALRFGVSFTRGQASLLEFVAYWSTQAILTLLRFGVIYEICRRLLGRYVGIWKACSAILFTVTAGLVLFATMANIRHGQYAARVILTIDRGVELGMLGVLLIAFSFCRYYRIHIDRLTGLIALGFGFYSAINILSNTFSDRWFRAFLPVWTEVRGDSFLLAEVIWFAAIWKPLPAPAPPPKLVEYQDYAEMAASVNVRLRQINHWLEEVLR